MKIRPGTRVVITGAGSGLGRQLALDLAARGAAVWVTDLQEALAAQTKVECLKAGAPKARHSRCDVREAGDVQSLAGEVEKEWSGLDLVVNNAGVAVAGAFEEQTLENWRWIVEINLMGVVHGCHYFLPLMKRAGTGHILNIASAAGLFSPPQLASYNATKAAVIALTETLSQEGRLTGIGASVACPTFFETGILANARLARPELQALGEECFKRSFSTASSVSRACLRAVERNQLYVLPSWDARILWAMKRFSPGVFNRLIGVVMPG